jgi:hypothetical protein
MNYGRPEPSCRPPLKPGCGNRSSIPWGAGFASRCAAARQSEWNGKSFVVGDAQSPAHLVGSMRFDSDNSRNPREKHPVVSHGESVELFELTES